MGHKMGHKMARKMGQKWVKNACLRKEQEWGVNGT